MWIKKYINYKNINISKKKYFLNFFTNKSKVKNFDVVFVLGYTKKLSNKFLENNILTLLVHESNAYGRGSAPMQWQVLKNKKNIRLFNYG